MVRKNIWIIMFIAFFICFGCNKEKNADLPNEGIVPSTQKPGEAQQESNIDYSINSYNYWNDVLGKQRKDIDFIVNWIKKAEYCDSISFNESGLSTVPDNQRIREKIQSEEDYEIIKRIMTENQYSIVNKWFSEHRVFLLHQFDMGTVSGNYCLVYAKGKLKKDEKNYKILDKNYYCEVIFYE